MSDTPRTDEAAKYDPHCNLANFARQLECELNAANVELARLRAGGCARDQRTTQFCAEAVALSKERDAWREVARELVASVDSMLVMVSESKGIAGWHLNGDLCYWPQVEAVEEMESAKIRFAALEKGMK